MVKLLNRKSNILYSLCIFWLQVGAKMALLAVRVGVTVFIAYYCWCNHGLLLHQFLVSWCLASLDSDFFFGALVNLRKKKTTNFRHVHPSVCLSTWNGSSPTGLSFIKFDIRVFFENLSKKIQFSYKVRHE
jgi:hypothetical protein